MSTEVKADCVTRIKIDNCDVFLEDLGNGKGKITISDTYDHNYSYFWGAMGSTLAEFLSGINKEYFAGKLMNSNSQWEMDTARTFKTIREHIKTELDLPFYKHMEFQKDMREKLREFQRDCENEGDNYFVSFFHSCFVNRLDFYLIDDRHERKEVESNFKGFCEVWNFIEQRHNKEYLWLERFHGKLKATLTPTPLNS